jgi:hypothetical protein
MSTDPAIVNTDRPSREGPKTVSFDFLKGNQFRNVHADGIWGGMTPQGQLSMSFFSERIAIPTKVTYRIEEDGKLGEEILEERVARAPVVRELEVCVFMNLGVAKAFQKFLNEQIEQIEKTVKKP